jgi:hypothetical protein
MRAPPSPQEKLPIKSHDSFVVRLHAKVTTPTLCYLSRQPLLLLSYPGQANPTGRWTRLDRPIYLNQKAGPH